MSSHQAQAIRELVKRNESKIGRYQNSKAQSLLVEQRRILNAVDGIASMRQNPNSLETPAAHALKLSKAAAKLQSESANIKNKVLQTYLSYDIELGDAINDRLGIKENHYAPEIRAMYRSLNSKERLDLISEAIANNDGPTFAAIMLAPSAVTGIPAAMKADLTNNYYLKAAPDLYQEKLDLKDAVEGMMATIRAAEGISNEVQNPEVIRKIENEVQQAQAATNQFNSALTQS
jgi:hypothetical protein